MKMLVSMVLLSALTAGIVSCSKSKIDFGPRTRQERIIANFTSIELRANADIYYTQSSLKSLVIEGPEAMMNFVETSFSGGNLVIRFTNGHAYDGNESIRIYISAPDVNSFALNNTGSIFFMNAVQQDALTLYNNGTGEIALKEVNVKHLEAYATGPGDITAREGVTQFETIKTSGSGNINLSAITAQSVFAHNIAAGKIQVKASSFLKVKIEGSGAVFYKGYPNLSTQVSGTGQLVHY